MAQIYLKHLGLSDRNNNGVIEKGAGEGYEVFSTKYGNADVGFYANRVFYGEADGKLEEPEIVNYYYLTIRFKPYFAKETEAIESEIKAYCYANNIPLIWLDDEQGTVMNAVNAILGEGWNRQEVTEDEAMRLYFRFMFGMEFRSRPEDPNKTGYYTLPEFVTNKKGYCVEYAHFEFWFLSQLKIISFMAEAPISEDENHALLILSSGRITDYTGGSFAAKAKIDGWHIVNPLRALGLHYMALGYFYKEKGDAVNRRITHEQAIIYNKYSLDNVYALMYAYYNISPSYYADNIIELGEFFIANNDIDKVLAAIPFRASSLKGQVKGILFVLSECYAIKGDKAGSENTKTLLGKYY
jgi:hypothetical protein